MEETGDGGIVCRSVLMYADDNDVKSDSNDLHNRVRDCVLGVVRREVNSEKGHDGEGIDEPRLHEYTGHLCQTSITIGVTAAVASSHV